MAQEIPTTTSQETAFSNRFLIVGLGNPGRKYAHNRHNIGFMAVSRLAKKYEISLTRMQTNALIGNGRIVNQSVILAKPQTYMNNSGEAVGSLVRFYKMPLQNVLIIYDELDIPFGTLRLRKKGGSGGHNGMKSIIQHIGDGFPRLRLGIGRPPGRMPPYAFLLQDFHRDELSLVDELLDFAVSVVESFLEEGIERAMTRHNSAKKSEVDGN